MWSSCCPGVSPPFQAEQATSPGFLTLASPHPGLPADALLGGPLRALSPASGDCLTAPVAGPSSLSPRAGAGTSLSKCRERKLG